LLIATMVFAALHAGEVLDRAGDGDGDVEVGGDDLAGLADLPGRRDHARVGGGAAGSEGAAEEVGQLLELLKLRPPHAAAAGDDDLGSVRAGRLLSVFCTPLTVTPRVLTCGPGSGVTATRRRRAGPVRTRCRGR
jgi:hypothetical protein